jgi:adenylate kinase
VGRLSWPPRDGGRADDTVEVIRHRQDVYAEQTAPLVEVYDGRGLLVPVDGMGPVDEVTSRVLRVLDQTGAAAS